MMSRALVLCGAVMVSLAGCDTPPTPTVDLIEGAQHIAFRCVDPENPGVGMPVDGCGCSQRVVGPDGVERLERLGRIACTCRDGLGDRVRYVRVEPGSCAADDSGAQVCTESVDPITGDWIPAEKDDALASPPTAAACEVKHRGQLRAYVTANGRGEVAVLDVTGNEPGDGSNPK